MNTKIVFLIGTPGSGKTTYATRLVKEDGSFIRVNRDEIRYMISGTWFPGDEYEPIVTSIVDSTIRAAISKKKNVVVDSTNCNYRRLKEDVKKWSKQANIEFKFIGCDLTIDQIKEQNRGRDRIVPEDVIDKMYKGFNNVAEHISDLKTIVVNNNTTLVPEIPLSLNIDDLPKAIIVDLDGTIAHHTSGRSPYDWHRVGEDSLDGNVARIIKLLSQHYLIIFVSGRSEICRKQTTDWLISHEFTVNQLHMRKADDYRKDSIVKKEIFIEIMRKYYIEMCFDDRQQVVDMARRELGLKVAQVAYGDF